MNVESGVARPALDSLNVADPALYESDAWAEPFRRMRAEDPVHYCRESLYGPYWSVTRYDDIMTVELDHATYSSAAEIGGIQVEDPPPEMNRPSFIRMDPPEHTEHRRTVAPIVAPTNLKNMEAAIRQRTGECLDALPRGQEFDWVDRVSIELTTAMLAVLFDFPWEDRRKLTWWSDIAITNIHAPDALVRTHAERDQELRGMAAYFKTLWDQRATAAPAFDLVSMLAHAPATRELPLPTFIGTLGLLIVGGNDTTRNSMTGGLMAFVDRPEELAKLRADPSLVPNAVAEIIRYHTPVLHMRRTATHDVTLGGKSIRKGDKVVMWYISGNRDESAIERPDEFQIDRAKARRHLSFGAGIHRCVGDRLAELQLKILWEEILKRDLRVEVTGPPKRLYSNFIRGIRALPVRIAA